MSHIGEHRFRYKVKNSWDVVKSHMECLRLLCFRLLLLSRCSCECLRQSL